MGYFNSEEIVSAGRYLPNYCCIETMYRHWSFKQSTGMISELPNC